MKKNIRNLVIGINLVILLFATYWCYQSSLQIEPIIVLLGQLSSLTILIFGEKINSKMKINKISSSKVKLDLSNDDNSDYKISDVKKGSDIKVKKS